MLVDLHVHTRLSRDSSTAPEEYLEVAARAAQKLSAICFTEHRLFPSDAELDRLYAELSQRFGILVFKGVEVDTDLGHLLVFGPTNGVMKRFDLGGRMQKSAALMEAVHAGGGIAIPAHPFRDSIFGLRLDALLAKVGPALSVIETLNGQNSPSENSLAITAAEKLGLTAVGGSDAHFTGPAWFLTCATELERDVSTVEALCEELRAGRARPYLFPRPKDSSGGTAESG